MEVSAEAKRIMVVALGKLYSSRTQRGGLRLHRSLLLTLVMKSARDMYHEAQATAQTDAPGCEQHTEERAEPRRTPLGHCAGSPEQTRTIQQEEVAGSKPEQPRYARKRRENKENLSPAAAAPQSRKRRNKPAAEPDFLPCKKAKLEQGLAPHQHVIVTAVLMDYVTCGGEVGAAPAPLPLHRAVAVC